MQQLGQQQLARGVLAVTGGILSHYDELLDAAVCQRLGLGQHLSIGTGGIRSAQLGNDAIGAAIITALGNL